MSSKSFQRSERIYRMLLKLYPEQYRKEFGSEMQYVFTQSLKDARREYGSRGIMNVWTRTIFDTGKSIINEHLDYNKGENIMKKQDTSIIMKNQIFLWNAVATGLILLIPLIAMQFDTGVDWSPFDFTVMGILIFGFSSAFVLVARRVSPQRRLLVGVLFLAAFMYVWAELAVGVFTDLGS